MAATNFVSAATSKSCFGCFVSKIMNEFKISNVVKVKSKPSTSQGDTAFAAQELLQNGILVETNKGLICMSLKDALNQGVGGVSLSEEDFQNVATRLLSFDDPPSKVIVAATVADDDSVLQVSDNDNLLHVKPTRTVLKSRTLLKPKSSTVTLSDLEGPSTSKVLDRKAIDSDDLDSVLVSDSGLSSDTSEAVSLSNLSSDSTPPKRRGGWPKGRKRKPENKSEIRQPKAPATGYVLFLNERRKDYKDLRFTEVTKLLGHEWSRLTFVEKRKYLEQAEVEKKRYREELKAYRQSDAYRQYLQRKRAKRLVGHGAEESDMDATDEIDDDEDGESDVLYCRLCDQWFQSLHNKKEHMYGRQHLASIAGRGKEEWIASTSLDESSMDGIRDEVLESKEPRPSTSMSMDDAIVRFAASNLQREREVSFLRQKLHEAEARNQLLASKMVEMKRKMEDSARLKQSEDKLQGILEQRIINLLGVSTLIEHNT